MLKRAHQLLIFVLTVGLSFGAFSSASAATPIKVKAIFVDKRDPENSCYGNFYVNILDLSLNPWDIPSTLKPMQRCGIKPLVNQKISGTKQMQVYENGAWIDLSESSGWLATSESYRDASKNISEYAVVRPLLSNNFGLLINDSKIKYIKEPDVSGVDLLWPSSPLPFTNGRCSEMYGKDVYDKNVSELKVRVKVVSKKKEYFSNSLTLIYKNNDALVWGKSDGYPCAVTLRSQFQPTEMTPNTSSNGTSSSQSGAVSICKTAAQSGNGLQYIKPSVNDLVLRQLVLQNSTNCFFTISVTAVFTCGASNVQGNTTLSIGPNESKMIMPGYYSQYFPTIMSECRKITGINNFAVYAAYPLKVLINIVSTN